ncbi:MAG: hypothetical protein IIC99_08750 [Chloroflexi bacterium]|nr:hypothetical protein [Chloroflexota bacterium]
MPAEEDIQKTIARFANGFGLKDRSLMGLALTDVLAMEYSGLKARRVRYMSGNEVRVQVVYPV